jgi:hypothetical protein
MGVRLFVAHNAIHQHPAADLTPVNLRRNAAGNHSERRGLRMRPRQRREVDLVWMPVDIHVIEQSALADVAEQLVGELLGGELLRCLRAVDGDDGPRSGRLMYLPHAHRTGADRNDGDQWQPCSLEESPGDRTLAHSITFQNRADLVFTGRPAGVHGPAAIYIPCRIDTSTAGGHVNALSGQGL